jgi:hypothetical protein
MPYLVIENFNGGLDSRRMPVAGTPGTLITLEDAHINRGGEIERRKAFSPLYTLPTGQTFGLKATTDRLYVFGSVATPVIPAGVTYQRLEHPTAVAMSELVDSCLFDGKVYAIARYTDGSVHHFYDGVRITAWDTLTGLDAVTNTADLAAYLGSLVSAGGGYTTNAVGSTLTVTGAVGVNFDASASTVNGTGGVTDQAVGVTTIQASVAVVTEVRAVGTITITGGTSSPGVNTLAGITVNGVGIMSGAVDWVTSNDATAAVVAADITSAVSAPEYTATSAGSVITITASVGTGSAPNGFAVVATGAGNVTATTTAITGGITAVAGVAKVVKFTFSGTFEVSDVYNIVLAGRTYTKDGNPTAKGLTCLTAKGKVYSTARSVLFFSALNAPAVLDPTSTETPGAGRIAMANQESGSTDLTAAAMYQGTLAVFSENTIQLWTIDPDPDLNVQIQSLTETGTRSPRSVVSVGNTDVFYLDRTGIRSLRARDSSNTATVSDVGTPIDDMLTDYVATLTETQIERAVAVIEPVSGNYWLAIGTKIFVFSYYPGSKISAWSTYTTTAAISDFTKSGTRLYIRSGDTISLYGGEAGTSYDIADVYPPVVITPFLNGGRIANHKEWTGFDAAMEGTWDVELLTNPTNLTHKTRVGTVSDTTYAGERVAVQVRTPYVAVKFRCRSAGYARISNTALHYMDGGAQ